MELPIKVQSLYGKAKSKTEQNEKLFQLLPSVGCAHDASSLLYKDRTRNPTLAGRISRLWLNATSSTVGSFSFDRVAETLRSVGSHRAGSLAC